jgi:deazaflavin-dependent oxidoreductase (nitroreductase family)
MANWLWFGTLHRKAYELTGGRIGANLIGMPVLLLTSVGRKTGQTRSTPMPYFEDAGRLVIVGSNNGSDRHPAWWFNLQASPETEVRIGNADRAVTARLATEAERADLWPRLQAWNKAYVHYEKQTDRLIPVVILEPR